MPNWSDENGRYWYTPIGAREEVEVPHPPVIVQKGCGCAFCKENRPKRRSKPNIQNIPIPSEVGKQLLDSMRKACGFAQIEPSKDLVEAELKRLRDEVARLRRELPQYDCRRTGGSVSDVSGRHCPPDFPCVSCQLDDAAQERDDALAKLAALQKACEPFAGLAQIVEMHGAPGSHRERHEDDSWETCLFYDNLIARVSAGELRALLALLPEGAGKDRIKEAYQKAYNEED